MTTRYIKAAKLFDGQTLHHHCALKIENKTVQAIVSHDDIPNDATIQPYQSGLLAPGFVDLQVNGGGGVLLNDDPSLETIKTICNAHRTFGTTALLPTLITDAPAKTKAAVEAAINAEAASTQGFAGLHLEGPHLSIKRQGAHDPALIRPMLQSDLDLLLYAKSNLPTLLSTIAPENVTLKQVEQLAKAGIIVSLGHTDCTYQTALDYFNAGATMVTHLFNAMSALGNREPGLVGAALETGTVSCGLIADTHHVHPSTMRSAIRAKCGPAPIFLVTDAMSTVGSDIQSFHLNNRQILRANNRLTLEDGTLAGADIDMLACVKSAHQNLNQPIEEAIAMASHHPATAIGRAATLGTLKPGAEANFLHLSDDLALLSLEAS